MTRGLVLAPLVLTLGATPLVALAQPEPPPEVRETVLEIPTDAPTVHAVRYRLENGLEVVLDPSPSDFVTVTVVYHAGASIQPAGWTGLAHLAEHTFFEGSTHAPGHFLDRLDALGVTEVNGVTERDQTRYYEVIPREHVERVLFLEADRMAFVLPHLDDARLATQREVVMREREEREDAYGLGTIPALISGVLYDTPGHPYFELGEHREDIEALHLPEIQWYLATYYGPDDATLVVTGGIDVEATRALVARYFGPIRRAGAAPVPVAAPEIVQVPVERRLVVEANIRRDQLRVIWPTPAFGTAEHAALELLAEHLRGRLRETLQDAADATQLDVVEHDYELASELAVSVVTGRREGTATALDALDHELETLEASPLTAHDLARLTWILLQTRLATLEGGTERAALLGRRTRHGEDGHWSLAWDLARWAAVTPERMAEVLRTWVSRHHRLVLSLAARREAPVEGRTVVDLSFDENGQEVHP